MNEWDKWVQMSMFSIPCSSVQQEDFPGCCVKRKLKHVPFFVVVETDNQKQWYQD